MTRLPRQVAMAGAGRASSLSEASSTAPTSTLERSLTRLRRHSLPYLLSLPAIALVILVSFYPTARAIYVSLYDTSYLELREFVGLANYRGVILDPVGQQNLLNSLVFVFASLVLVLPLGMGLALVLNRAIRYRVIYRAIVILPWVISQTLVALLWTWVLNAHFGPLVGLMSRLGLPRVEVLASTGSAMAALVVANVWNSFPYALILLLAALQTVPGQLYESASIDGCNSWDRFRYVTFPFIRSTVLIVVIMLSLHYFNMVTLVLTMTNGGPANATEVISLRAYKEAFSAWRIGYASAVGVTIFLINIVFSLGYIRLLRREPLY